MKTTIWRVILISIWMKLNIKRIKLLLRRKNFLVWKLTLSTLIGFCIWSQTWCIFFMKRRCSLSETLISLNLQTTCYKKKSKEDSYLAEYSQAKISWKELLLFCCCENIWKKKVKNGWLNNFESQVGPQ